MHTNKTKDNSFFPSNKAHSPFPRHMTSVQVGGVA